MSEWIKGMPEKNCVFVVRIYDDHNEYYEYQLWVMTADYYDDEAGFTGIYTGDGEFYCLPEDMVVLEHKVIEYL